MRFQPSHYSDVAEVAPAAEAPPSPTQSAATMGIQLVGKAAEIGLDKWRASSDAKLAAWAAKAEKKKKKAAPPVVVAPPPPPSPWAMSPMTKWALVGLGTLAVGATVYVLFFKHKDEEPAPARRNPKLPKPRLAVKRPSVIRSAKTEIPSRDEDTGRDEQQSEESAEDESYESDEYAGESE